MPIEHDPAPETERSVKAQEALKKSYEESVDALKAYSEALSANLEKADKRLRFLKDEAAAGRATTEQVEAQRRKVIELSTAIVKAEDAQVKFTKSMEGGSVAAKLEAAATVFLSNEISGFVNRVTDAVKWNLEYKLSLQETAKTLGNLATGHEDSIKSLMQMKDALRLTREEFDKFKSRLSEAVDVGIDVKKIEELGKALQTALGKEVGQRKLEIALTAGPAGLAAAQATGKTDAEFLQAIAGYSLEQRNALKDVRQALLQRERGEGAGPDQQMSLNMAETAKTMDDVKAHAANIAQKYLAPIWATGLPAIIGMAASTGMILFELKSIHRAIRGMGGKGGGLTGTPLDDLLDLADLLPEGKGKKKGARKAGRARTPRRGAAPKTRLGGAARGAGRAGRVTKVAGAAKTVIAVEETARAAKGASDAAKAAKTASTAMTGTKAAITGGKIAATGAKAASVVGIAGLAAELGFGYFEDKAREKGDEKTARKLGLGAAAGSIAGMASTGFMLGGLTGPAAPVLAPLGAVVGAAVGVAMEKDRIKAGAQAFMGKGELFGKDEFLGKMLRGGNLGTDLISGGLGGAVFGPIVREWAAEVDRMEKTEELARSKTLEHAEAMAKSIGTLDGFEKQLASATAVAAKGTTQAIGRQAAAEAAGLTKAGFELATPAKLLEKQQQEVGGVRAKREKFVEGQKETVDSARSAISSYDEDVAAARREEREAHEKAQAKDKELREYMNKNNLEEYDARAKDIKAEEAGYRKREANARSTLNVLQSTLETSKGIVATYETEMRKLDDEVEAAENVAALHEKLAKAIEVSVAPAKIQAKTQQILLGVYGTISGTTERVAEVFNKRTAVAQKELGYLAQAREGEKKALDSRVKAIQEDFAKGRITDPKVRDERMARAKREGEALIADTERKMAEAVAEIMSATGEAMQSAAQAAISSGASKIRQSQMDLVKTQMEAAMAGGLSPEKQGAMAKALADLAVDQANALAQALPQQLQEIDAIAANAKAKIQKDLRKGAISKEDAQDAERKIETDRVTNSIRAQIEAEKARKTAIDAMITSAMQAGDAEKKRLDIQKTALEAQKGTAEFLGMSYGVQLSIAKDILRIKRQEFEITKDQLKKAIAIAAATGKPEDQAKVQELQKRAALEQADIIKQSVGLQRDFLDKALGKAFGTPTGSRFQPAITNRALFGEHMIGQGGIRIRGQIPLEEQRRQMMNAGLGPLAERPGGKPGINFGPGGAQLGMIPANPLGGAGGGPAVGAAAGGAAQAGAPGQPAGVNLPGGLAVQVMGKIDIEVKKTKEFDTIVNENIRTIVREMAVLNDRGRAQPRGT